MQTVCGPPVLWPSGRVRFGRASYSDPRPRRAVLTMHPRHRKGRFYHKQCLFTGMPHPNTATVTAMNRPIACFFDHQEALSQVELLKTAEIEAEILSESDTSERDQPVHVHCVVVDAVDETKALDLLDRRMNNEGGRSLVRCPSCGSFHTEYPGRPRSSPSASFVAGVIDKLGEMAQLNAKNFHCHNCGLSFHPRDAVVASRGDIKAEASHD